MPGSVPNDEDAPAAEPGHLTVLAGNAFGLRDRSA